MITVEQFNDMFPKNKNAQSWTTAMVAVLPTYQIDTPERIASFLAQCGHESGGFTVLQENLNYSAEGLNKIFKKYFPTLESAQPYARKPELIANKVYANRMGNGDEQSGEGYRYRGRGPIQLTGKDNYTACSDFLFQDDTLLKDPDMLLDPEYALHSACWFWWKNDLNTFADSADLLTMTKRINGGTIGLDDRIAHYNHAMEIFA
jgi:putative chitinase